MSPNPETERERSETRTSGRAAPGPVFVSGRQNSGNSVLTKILGQAPGCLAFIEDNGFIEQCGLIDRVEVPRARVMRAIEAMPFVERPDLKPGTEAHLLSWIETHPEAQALAIYLEAMRHCLEGTGRRFWLQKATSYIFYAAEILSSVEGAKFVYVMRNPYDLVSSRTRRDRASGIKMDRYWGRLIGWRKGVRLAEELQRSYPDRFLIVQYERLVTTPEESLPKVFEFVGYEYRPEFADVPRINTSEKPLDWKGDEAAPRGLSGFKVFSYTTTLTPTQIRATDLMLPRRLVSRWYPDLPTLTQRTGPVTTLKALGMLGWHFVRFIRMQITRYPNVTSRKRFLIDRSLRRLRA